MGGAGVHKATEVVASVQKDHTSTKTAVVVGGKWKTKLPQPLHSGGWKNEKEMANENVGFS